MLKTSIINIGQAKLAIQQAGSGDALVFLHAGVADKRMWQNQLQYFKDSHHVIAYDRRGFGETQTADEAFSHVQDLAALLDQLEIKKASFLGCSQGGRIAIDFCLAHPERVSKLVLIAPAVSGAPYPKTFSPDVQHRLDALDKAEAADDIERINALEALLWLDGPSSLEGRVGKDLRALFLDMNGIALAAPELNKEREAPSAYTRLAEITMSSLVLWGELDFAYIKERCQYLLTVMQNAQGQEIPQAAHLPNLEHPQIINELLKDFLTQA